MAAKRAAERDGGQRAEGGPKLAVLARDDPLARVVRADERADARAREGAAPVGGHHTLVGRIRAGAHTADPPRGS